MKTTYQFFNEKGIPLIGTIRKDGTIHFNGLNANEIANHFKQR